jgi:hypothetical protein
MKGSAEMMPDMTPSSETVSNAALLANEVYSRSYPNRRNPTVAMTDTIKSSDRPRIPMKRGCFAAVIGGLSDILGQTPDVEFARRVPESYVVSRIGEQMLSNEAYDHAEVGVHLL